MLFIVAGSKCNLLLLWRAFRLDQRLGRSVPHLIISELVLVVTRAERDCLLLIPLLTDCPGVHSFCKVIVFLILTRPNPGLLSLRRASRVKMSFSVFIFS
jgi:hypothetical protein